MSTEVLKPEKLNGAAHDIQTGGDPSEMIRFALEKGADLSQLRELLSLQKDFEANEARKAFHKAVAEFKKNPPKITKDKQNAQYKSMYTTLGNLVNTVNPELSKHGLSASWEIKQNGQIEVTCVLTHSLGHSERTSASAPADVSGAKNVIQQIKSTITYLKAVTFESITGLASTDANYDDDGLAVGKEVITEQEYSRLLDHINNEGLGEKQVCDYLKVADLKNLPKADLQKAMRIKKVAKK